MIQLKNNGKKSCSALLETYRQSGRKPLMVEKLMFDKVNMRDVYNIAAPFIDEGEYVLPGRVEHRDSEQSEVHFFVQRGGKWVPRENAPVFALQDPFYTWIRGELIFGGVETFPHPQDPGMLSWRTVFYKGPNIARLEIFFSGPDQMKDLRFVEQADGSIGIFTRPQGVKGGRGKIGYTAVDSLKEITHKLIDEAPILDQQFFDDEWGGSNEIHLLSNGLLGVLGHIAQFDEEGNRHYYPMVFAFNPDNRSYSDMEIIAERANFVKGPAKRTDLVDVVFSGGLIRHQDGTADLYAGISDAEAQKIRIVDPFLAYERSYVRV